MQGQGWFWTVELLLQMEGRVLQRRRYNERNKKRFNSIQDTAIYNRTHHVDGIGEKVNP